MRVNNQTRKSPRIKWFKKCKAELAIIIKKRTMESMEILIKNHENNDFAQHEEIRRLNVIQTKNIAIQSESIDRLTRAMFGEKDSKELGTKEKVDEIYELLVAGGVIKKTLAWTFGAIVSVGAAMYMFFNFWKDLNKD